MNILLIAPVHNEKLLLEQNNKLPFPSTQAQQAWLNALNNLGHTTHVFRYTDSIFLPRKIKVESEKLMSKAPRLKAKLQRMHDKYYYLSIENRIRNRRLYQAALHFYPRLIIVSGGAFNLFPKTLQKIKYTLQCKIVLLSGVNPVHGSPPAENKMVTEKVFDYVFVNDKGFAKEWKKFGAKNVIVLPVSSLDTRVYKKEELTMKELSEYGSDICYVGTLTKDRQNILTELSNFNLKIWGDIPYSVGLNDNLKNFYYGKAQGGKVVKIYNAAKIVLNLHAEEMRYGGNMRTFEIPGTGVLQLIDHVDPSWFEDGKEIVVFNDKKDLMMKIQYYLSHEKIRKRIAESGYIRAVKEHTYEEHFKKLLQTI